MERNGGPSPRRPLLLLGRKTEAISALARAPALRTCFVVATPDECAVEELISAVKPTAVLLEASEFYMEGRKIHWRLKERSRGSRILFLDIDRTWALWMEISSEETNDLLIAPCEVPRMGETLMELLNGTSTRRFPAPREESRLESTG